MANVKPLGKRAKARLAKMRRDPFGRLALEVGRYLETVGWRVVVAGKPQVRGFEQDGVGNYEFVVEFSGGRIKKRDADSSAVAQSGEPARTAEPSND